MVKCSGALVETSCSHPNDSTTLETTCIQHLSKLAVVVTSTLGGSNRTYTQGMQIAANVNIRTAPAAKYLYQTPLPSIRTAPTAQCSHLTPLLCGDFETPLTVCSKYCSYSAPRRYQYDKRARSTRTVRDTSNATRTRTAKTPNALSLRSQTASARP